MTKFQKIKQLILDYREVADRHYANYQKKERAAREKFSEAGFKQEFMQKTWVEMAGQIWAEADDSIRKIMEIFNEIEGDLKKWITRPLDASTTQILDCIKNFDLKLSLNELQVIEECIRSSYMGAKIFAGLAQKNGYNIVTLSMKEYQDALKAARNNASFAICAYAGSPDDKFPGKDLLQEWTYQGVTYGEYTPHHMFMAYNYLCDGGELDRLETMWGAACAPMKYSLTPDESEKVKKSLEGIMSNGGINEKAAQQLIEKEPDFKNKLQSMPHNFFEGKESVINYFSLNDKSEKKESKISPAIQQATEYKASRLEKIDEDTLKNFK